MRAVVLAVLVLMSGSARADDVGVIVVGEPTLQAPLAAHLEAWLVAKGHRVVGAPFETEDRKRTFVDCFVIEDIKCATGVFAKTAVTYVLLARAELVAGEGRHVNVTAYWFAKQRDAVAEKRACNGCDDAALRGTAASLLDALAPKAPSVPKPRERGGLVGRLGPALLIGGGAATVIGGTGFLYYGSKGGPDEPYEYPGATKAGVVMTIAGAAAVAGGALWWRAVGKRERSRYVPPALVAVGVAAVIAGSIALSYGAKRGSDEVFVYDNATAIGAPLAIAGGGVLIAGGMQWLFDAKGER